MTRRVGESLKIGEYRLMLRTRSVGGVTLTTLHQGQISIRDIEFGQPLQLNQEIIVYPYPNNREGFSKSIHQAKISISAPKHIKIQRDELEVGYCRNEKTNQKYLGAMT